MKAYTERPPITARAARRAWDHFATKETKHRKIGTLYYSPNYRNDFRAWVVDWKFSDAAMGLAVSSWGSAYDTSWMHAAVPAHALLNAEAK